MSSRIEKYKKKYNALTASQSYMATKNLAIKKESIATRDLVKIESQIKQIVQGEPTTLLPYYIIFGKEIYSKMRKLTHQTLINEVMILERKWRTRGLNDLLLEEIKTLLIPEYKPPAGIPIGGRILWTGPAATIPTGWTRDTLFDDRYIQGDDIPFSTIWGGVASHSHTANAHTHTGIQHRHSFFSDTQTGVATGAQFSGSILFQGSQPTHSHPTAAGSYTVITYQNMILTINTDNTDQLFIRAIVIMPNDDDQRIPPNASCWTDQTTPTGFSKLAAADGRFIKGAVALGDGGGIGGNANHTHTTINHTHAIDNHSHAEALCGPSAGRRVFIGGKAIKNTAHHNISMASKALADLSTDGVTVNNTSTDPSYMELLGIQNTSVSPLLPSGVIIAYVDPYNPAVDTLPAGWKFCDGSAGTPDLRDKQIKCTINDINVGNIGGSNTHTHTTNAHGHIHTAAHNHIWGGQSYNDITCTAGITLVIDTVPWDKHSHNWTFNTTTPNLQNANVTMSTDDGRKSYKTVIYLKKD